MNQVWLVLVMIAISAAASHAELTPPPSGTPYSVPLSPPSATPSGTPYSLPTPPPTPTPPPSSTPYSVPIHPPSTPTPPPSGNNIVPIHPPSTPTPPPSGTPYSVPIHPPSTPTPPPSGTPYSVPIHPPSTPTPPPSGNSVPIHPPTPTPPPYSVPIHPPSTPTPPPHATPTPPPSGTPYCVPIHPPSTPTPPPSTPIHPPTSVPTHPPSTPTNPPSQPWDCESSRVKFWLTVPINATCGDEIIATLTYSNYCPLVTGGALICDWRLRNCQSCPVERATPNGKGWILKCKAIDYPGIQVVTATYRLGVLDGTIARATPLPVHCVVPDKREEMEQVENQSELQVVEQAEEAICDPSTVSFNLNGPFNCGKEFTATLKTTSDKCKLASGGAVLCDALNRNCVHCAVSGDSPELTYTCSALTSPGQQIMTAAYQLGRFIGAINRSQNMYCP